MSTATCDALIPGDVPSSPTTTYFAPAGRDTAEEVHRKGSAFKGIPLLSESLNAMPSMVMVLNSNRQIVAANDTMLSVLNTSLGEVTEKRPGEAVGCIRAKEGPDGCGTARYCAACGAVNAILDAQKQRKKVVRECRILVQTPSGIAPMDLRVVASPISVAEDHFVVTAVDDISQSKRLHVLQRTFFHDVLNTAGCIQGYAQYLQEDASGDPEVCGRLATLSDQLIESIRAQRDLVIAESGELDTKPVPIRVRSVLEEVMTQYAAHPVAEGRDIDCRDDWDGTVIADRQLLFRVLGNMVKNALEATSPGGIVTIGCKDGGSRAEFWVHNPDVMPDEVQLQVFQRSFSTKGEQGRGIGTYSMKLLGERYLGGKVDFVSKSPEGTTFMFLLPKTPVSVQ